MISGLLSLAGAAILVVIDQLIKHWATAALLPVGSMDVLPGVVELRYCLNDGMDYINVLFMRFAIFNFADICVCVGVGLLMLAVLLDSFKKDKTAEPKADEDGAV